MTALASRGPVLRKVATFEIEPHRAVDRAGARDERGHLAHRHPRPPPRRPRRRRPARRAAPTRSANQPWAACRQAGSASRSGSVPIASNITARRSTSRDGIRGGGLPDHDAGCRGAHGRRAAPAPGRPPDAASVTAAARAASRRRVSARPSGESGRSHHDSTHHVAPASRPRLRPAGAPSPNDRGCRPRRRRRSPPSTARRRPASVPIRSTTSCSAVDGEAASAGSSRLPPATAGKTPCQRAARSSERCRGRPGDEHRRRTTPAGAAAARAAGGRAR